MTCTRKTIRSWATVCALLCVCMVSEAQSLIGRGMRVSIFSSTPLEDIKAASDKCTGVIVTGSAEVAMQVPIKSLEFDRKMMQEHFNENYMESDKYPFAKFKGKLEQKLDFAVDGDYQVSVRGILSVHGVDRERTIPCQLRVSHGEVFLTTQFNVACKDHEIKIPTLVFAKIAENIQVTASGKLQPSE